MKHIKCFNKRNYLLIIFSFLLLSIISAVLFLHFNKLFAAYDMQFHIKRIMELKNSISHGDFFPLFSTNYFHGSALMSMYPYFSLYPIVLLSFAFSSFIKVYYFSFIFYIFVALLVSFFSSLNYSKSIATSYLFSISYSMSSMFVMNTFANGDWGITTSLVFMPLVIFGYLDLLNNYQNYYKLSLGVSLMIMSQLSAVFITLLFLFIWFLINIDKLNKFIFINFVKAVALTVLLTAIVWIPFLHIILFNDIKSVTLYRFQGVGLKALVKYISLTSLLILPIGLIYYKKLSRILKQMLIISLFTILLFSNLVPWKLITNLNLFKFINQFQFGYRFLIIPQLFLSYLFAYICIKVAYNKAIRNFILVIITIFIVLLQLFSQFAVIHTRLSENHITIDNINDPKIALVNRERYIVPNNLGVKYLANGYLNIDDYYPKQAESKVNDINNNYGLYNHKLINLTHVRYNTFEFKDHKNINKFTLPMIQYNGERIKVYLNHHLIRHSINKNKLINIQDIKPGSNNIYIKYVPNILLLILKVLLCLLGIIWIIINYFRNKKEVL